MSSLLSYLNDALPNWGKVGKEKTILVVEDDPQFQLIFKSKLERKNVSVTVVNTVDKAEIVIGQQSPDLILLDIMLPGGKNGFDLLTNLKKKIEEEKIPVIVLTNLSENEARTAHDLGAAGFFVKAETLIEDVMAQIDSFLKTNNSV